MTSFLIGNGRNPGFDWREKELSRTTPLKIWFFLGGLIGSRPKLKSENCCFGFAEEAFTCEEVSSFILSYEIVEVHFIYYISLTSDH